MADKTGISWTQATWNAIVGCTIISAGCANCYAMKQANRLLDKPGSHYHGTTKKVNGNAVWTGKTARAPDHIFYQPLRWTRGRMIFANSMSDLFHPDIPYETIVEILAIAMLTPQHTYQILTKREARLARVMADQGLPHDVYKKALDLFVTGKSNTAPPLKTLSVWPLKNVWLGVSAENQSAWDDRVPFLRDAPAAVRFVSVEPQIGKIITKSLRGIDWVIVGGESGPKARPFEMDWAFSMLRECKADNVPFFMKQMGSVVTFGGEPRAFSGKGDDPKEWPITLQVQEFPHV